MNETLSAQSSGEIVDHCTNDFIDKIIQELK